MECLISVIIPVYNVEKYLKRCLDSLINQTLKDIEIICIDDCSTDNSLAILKEYADKDKRIKLIHLEANRGVAVARNEGLQIAKGEYIGFVDSDDFVDLDFYEKLYKKAKETDADVVHGRIKMYNYQGDCTIDNINDLIRQKHSKLIFAYYFCIAIYSSKLINDNNIRFDKYPLAEDVLFVNEAILKSKKLELVDDTFYHYIKRENSSYSALLPKNKIDSALTVHEKILDNILEYYKTHPNETNGVHYICEWSLYNVINYTYRLKTLDNLKLCTDTVFNMYEKIKKHLQTFKFNSLSLEMDYLEHNDKEGLMKFYQDNCSIKKWTIANIRHMYLQKNKSKI